MSVLLDILVIIVIAVFVILDFKKGILKTAISVAGTFVASAVSVFLSDPIADGIYNSVIKASFSEKIEESMKMSAQTGSGNAISNICDTLPDFVNNALLNFGISEKELTSAAAKGADAVETLISPIIISFISIIVSILIFILLMVIIKLVSKIICAAVDNSAIGIVNRFLGGLMGLVEGFIIVFVIMFVIRLTVPHLSQVPAIISDETVSNSTVFKGIYDSELLTGIVSTITVSPNVD